MKTNATKLFKQLINHPIGDGKNDVIFYIVAVNLIQLLVISTLLIKYADALFKHKP